MNLRILLQKLVFWLEHFFCSSVAKTLLERINAICILGRIQYMENPILKYLYPNCVPIVKIEPKIQTMTASTVPKTHTKPLSKTGQMPLPSHSIHIHIVTRSDRVKNLKYKIVMIFIDILCFSVLFEYLNIVCHGDGFRMSLYKLSVFILFQFAFPNAR